MCISHQDFLASIPDGESQLHSSMDQGGIVCPNTAPTGCDRINQQLQTASDKLKSLIQQAERSQRKLGEGVDLQQSYDESYQELRDWMTETDKVLQGDEDLGEGQLEAKQAYLLKIKVRNGLRLRFPHGHPKFDKIITNEDVQKWELRQRFLMICSKSKGFRYVSTFMHNHSHTAHARMHPPTTHTYMHMHAHARHRTSTNSQE